MEVKRISFGSIKFDKSVTKEYKKIISSNPEIMDKAASKYNIKTSLSQRVSKVDSDSWKILKFQISKKGLLGHFVKKYLTITSANVNKFDDDIFEKVKKLKIKNFDEGK